VIFATVPAIDKEGAYALRRHPAGDDPRRRLAAQPGGVVGQCCSAWAGPWARPSRPRWSSVVAVITSHLFAAGYDMPRHREPIRRGLREFRARADRLGVLLFVITIVVNLVRSRGRGTLRPAQEGGLMTAMSSQRSTCASGRLAAQQEPDRPHADGAVVRVVLIPLGFVLYTVIARALRRSAGRS